MGLVEEIGTFLHEQSYLDLDGTSGTFASTPDSAALSVTGDLQITARVSLDDWTPAAENTIVSKWATGQRSFQFTVRTNGALRLNWSSDGSASNAEVSTATVGFTDGTTHWVRVNFDVDDGAGNRVTTFFTSEDGVTFTQLGSAVTTAGTASIFDSTSNVEIGSRDSGTAERLAGKMFSVEVRDGIGGTIVADPDFSDGTVWSTSTTSASDDAGNTWTLNGAATIAGRDNFGLGSNLFLNALPDEPNNANSIIETGGIAPNHVFAGDRPAWENARVAVTSRSTSSTEARDDANIAWFALQEISNSTLSGVSWLRVSAVQSPFLLERDERNRAVFQANYDCVRRTTST